MAEFEKKKKQKFKLNSSIFTADRAKQIRTVAIVNEDPTEKLIRELRQENERLKKMLEKGAMDVPIHPGMSEEGTGIFIRHSMIRLFHSLYSI